MIFIAVDFSETEIVKHGIGVDFFRYQTQFTSKLETRFVL